MMSKALIIGSVAALVALALGHWVSGQLAIAATIVAQAGR